MNMWKMNQVKKMVVLVMTIIIALIISSIASDFVPLSFAKRGNSLRNTPQKIHKRIPKGWHRANCQGLFLGKSKQKDVIRKFGIPIWSGPPEEKLFPLEREGELWYEYENVGGLEGATTIVLGVSSKIVKGIMLYPKDLSYKEVLEKYGDEFIRRNGQLGPCPNSREAQLFKNKSSKIYPVFLVYQKKGMYVTLQEGDKISEIGFLLYCL